MTRAEAIDLFRATWGQRDSEFCVGAAEHEASEREMVEAFHALGVTDEELAAR